MLLLTRPDAKIQVLQLNQKCHRGLLYPQPRFLAKKTEFVKTYAQQLKLNLKEMAQKKKQNKKVKSKSAEVESETENDVAEIGDPKTKKVIDIEAALEPAAIVDEKIEDEIPPIAEDLEDASSEEISLDDDELNPFGDKWEQ